MAVLCLFICCIDRPSEARVGKKRRCFPCSFDPATSTTLTTYLHSSLHYTRPTIAYTTPSILSLASSSSSSYFPPPIASERANKQPSNHRLTFTFVMPAPSAAQQKALVNEVVSVLQVDSKTAAKLLAKSGWNTSNAVNGYVHASLLPCVALLSGFAQEKDSRSRREWSARGIPYRMTGH